MIFFQQESDPQKVLKQKQSDLLERLKAQTESLNKLLGNFGKTTSEEKKATPTKKDKAPGTAAAPSHADPAEKNGKKDKDAKKEARKAAKAEALKKVATGEAPAQKEKGSVAGEKAWTVKDDRKTWEHGLSLTVNIPASLVLYPSEHLGEVTLTVTPADNQWVALLAKVGEKRQVVFNGAVSNKSKDAKTSVKVASGKFFLKTLKPWTLRSRNISRVWTNYGEISSDYLEASRISPWSFLEKATASA